MGYIPKVAIIGRPNVGKSTLFNKLCGKRLSIASNIPGTTRDYKEYSAVLDNIHFIAVDTAGWEEKCRVLDANDSSCVRDKMIHYTKRALSVVDVVLFLLDGQSHLTSDDIALMRLVRKSGKVVVVVVNKSEGCRVLEEDEIHRLGVVLEPVFISALHGYNLDGLRNVMGGVMRDVVEKYSASAQVPFVQREHNKAEFSIAIVGRPNVGKSTLFNTLLDAERAITSDVAGTTRDCIEQSVKINGKTVSLTDTAGVRRRGKVVDIVEGAALGQSITAIRRSSVILLIMDATDVFTKQDIAIAKIAINEGKPLILVVNKVDLVENKILLRKAMKESVECNFPDVYAVPTVYVSALGKRGMSNLIDITFKAFRAWQQSFSTSMLNEWLSSVTAKHLPRRTSSGLRTKLKYITQKATKPPTFMVFSNTDSIPAAYTRYMRKSLAQSFDMRGIPIRFIFGKAKNPYAGGS